MTTRTTTTTVTFASAFMIGDFDELLPAGTYRVVCDEELLEGLSFAAYRRVLTRIDLNPVSGRSGFSQMLTIDAKALESALARDANGKPA